MTVRGSGSVRVMATYEPPPAKSYARAAPFPIAPGPPTSVPVAPGNSGPLEKTHGLGDVAPSKSSMTNSLAAAADATVRTIEDTHTIRAIACMAEIVLSLRYDAPGAALATSQDAGRFARRSVRRHRGWGPGARDRGGRDALQRRAGSPRAGPVRRGVRQADGEREARRRGRDAPQPRRLLREDGPDRHGMGRLQAGGGHGPHGQAARPAEDRRRARRGARAEDPQAGARRDPSDARARSAPRRHAPGSGRVVCLVPVGARHGSRRSRPPKPTSSRSALL